MIKQENPNFVASFYAPNPMEVTYWIDLSTDANGNVIKSYTGNDWLPVNYFTNTDQSVEIKKLKQEIADEVKRAKQAEQKLTNDLRQVAAALGDDPNFATTMTNQLGTKANKSDVYTKSEANNKINTAVANKVTSTDVTQIKIVDEVPEVGSQTPGILYIKLSA